MLKSTKPPLKKKPSSDKFDILERINKKLQKLLKNSDRLDAIEKSIDEIKTELIGHTGKEYKLMIDALEQQVLQLTEENKKLKERDKESSKLLDEFYQQSLKDGLVKDTLCKIIKNKITTDHWIE